MPEFLILREIGLIIVAAAALGILARRAGLPPLLAYMVAGVFLGPVTGLVTITEDVELVAESGIALLLFLVGLELNVATLRDAGRAAVLGGMGQAILTAGGAYFIAKLLGFSGGNAIVLAVGVTFSSTVIAVKVLEERHELATLFGRIALGILLLQDLAAVIVLTVLSVLGASPEQGSLLSRLAQALVGGLALTGAALVIATRLLHGLFRWLSTRPEALFVCSLAWCFAFMAAASRLGLSLEIGAFVAGIGLAQLPWNVELRRRVHPLASFFVAVFFVSVGLRIPASGALSNLEAMLVLGAFVLVIKPAILTVLLARLGFSPRTTFMASLSLAQVSEFSLIIAALAAQRGLISDPITPILSVLALFTCAVSATALQNADVWLARFQRSPLRRFLGTADEPPEPPGRSRHIIVVGMNTLGRILVRELAARGETVLALDSDPQKLNDLPAESMVANVGHRSVLVDANLHAAKLLISALQIEDMNNLLAYRCRIAGVPCAIHAFDMQVVPDLRQLNVDYIMASKHDGIRQMVAEMRRAGVVE
jgi:Kef-type K+ transport system membrane component KefB